MLQLADGSGEWVYPQGTISENFIMNLQYRLPSGITCERCILEVLRCSIELIMERPECKMISWSGVPGAWSECCSHYAHHLFLQYKFHVRAPVPSRQQTSADACCDAQHPIIETFAGRSGGGLRDTCASHQA